MLEQALMRDELLLSKSRHMLPGQLHYYRNPPLITRGAMQYLFDETGKKYLDCFSGVGVASAGHCNPEITAAIGGQLEVLQHTTAIYLTEPQLRLAEKLAATTGGRLPRVFFSNSGSEANETALLMARIATSRNAIMALEHSLHGRTRAAMNVSQLPLWRSDPAPAPDVIFAPSYTDPDSAETIAALCAGAPEPPAALIVEPIQGNGGINVPPAHWFAAIRAICDRFSVLLIADEVQTGMNRTGRQWAMRHWNVWPDILVTAKALGNGQPVAATLASEAVALAQTRPTASTFGGNPVSMAAALATLEYHERHQLAQRAERLGAFLKDQLRRLQLRFECIAAVRGLGLMLGLEMNHGGEEASKRFVDDVLEKLKDAGFLAGRTGVGRNVLTFMPPLVITERNLQDLVEHLDTILQHSSGVG